MNQWAFVIAAYAVTIGGGALLGVVSYVQMRRAEKRVAGGVERPLARDGDR